MVGRSQPLYEDADVELLGQYQHGPKVPPSAQGREVAHGDYLAEIVRVRRMLRFAAGVFVGMYIAHNYDVKKIEDAVQRELRKWKK